MQPSMRKVTDGAMENPTTTSPSEPLTFDADLRDLFLPSLLET